MIAPSKTAARNVRKPARPTPALRRERLHADAPALEQEADRIATGAMAGGAALFGAPRPLAPRVPLSCIPLAAQRALRDSGQPMDGATRAFMESRLGYDFSAVRILDGAEASRGAEALGAHAFAAGDRIVFDAGQYRPHDSQGRWLLAHELAHIVQQAHGATPALLHKGKKKPVKFFQPVIDEIAASHRTDGAESDNLTMLNHLLALCEAADQEKTGDISKLIDALSKDNFSASTGLVASNIMGVLVARLDLLGLDGEGRKLERQFPSSLQPLENRELDLADDAVAAALAVKDISSPVATEHSFTALVNAMKALRNFYSDANHDPGRFHRTHVSRGAYLEQMYAKILQVVHAQQALIQSILDAARADLEKGGSKGGKILKQLHELMMTVLLPAISEDPPHLMLPVPIPIIHVDIAGKGHGVIKDVFPPDGGHPRSVKVDSYDPQETEVADQKISMAELFRRRMDQIGVMAQLYGLTDLARGFEADPVEAAAAAKEADANKQALAKTPGKRLKLDNNDDWRAFVVAKFHSLTKPPAGKPALANDEALRAVVETLFLYLRTFAVHVHSVSIYDFGDSYLTRDFPRALSGQLVHDCGVYAVRVAYILSLLQGELGLKFRFVLLPAHVALAMQVKDGTIYIFENDQFHEFAPDDIALLRACFNNPSEGCFDVRRNADPAAEKAGEEAAEGKSGTAKSRDAKGTGAKAGAKGTAPFDEDQFVGELAAGNYIEAPADMPFALVDIPPGKTVKDTRKKLWDAYEQGAKTQLFGDSDADKDTANFLLMKDYLALLDMMREVHSTVLATIWNEKLPPLWEGFVATMPRGTAGAPPTIDARRAVALIEGYAANYHAALAPLEARQAQINAAANAISDKLKANKKLRNASAKLSNGVRAFAMVSQPLRAYGEKLKSLRTILPALPSPNIPVPLLIDEAVQSSISAFPPFMPQPRNSINPED